MIKYKLNLADCLIQNEKMNIRLANEKLLTCSTGLNEAQLMTFSTMVHKEMGQYRYEEFREDTYQTVRLVP